MDHVAIDALRSWARPDRRATVPGDARSNFSSTTMGQVGLGRAKRRWPDTDQTMARRTRPRDFTCPFDRERRIRHRAAPASRRAWLGGRARRLAARSGSLLLRTG